MHADFDFESDVVLVTGASGALGSAVCRAFDDAGATVCGTDVVAPDDDTELDRGEVSFYKGDLTDEEAAEQVISGVVEAHGDLDVLCNVAGMWKGGSPIHETDVETFDQVFDVNLKTMFLASKHALPHLQASGGNAESGGGSESGGDSESGGNIVSVSARASLEGGEGDGPYRAAKAGVRLLTETIAEENRGDVRANAVMPSVIDTPQNREMMPDADHDSWVDPRDIARVVMALCSDATVPTSGGAIPVYGEA